MLSYVTVYTLRHVSDCSVSTMTVFSFKKNCFHWLKTIDFVFRWLRMSQDCSYGRAPSSGCTTRLYFLLWFRYRSFISNRKQKNREFALLDFWLCVYRRFEIRWFKCEGRKVNLHLLYGSLLEQLMFTMLIVDVLCLFKKKCYTLFILVTFF